MKREITVLVCLAVLGDGRYLNDDRINYISQSDFDLKGLKESYNTKREIEEHIPEDRLTDNTKTERNEELAEENKHKTELTEETMRRQVLMALRAQPAKKTYASHVYSEIEGYSHNKYELALLPDYVIYNGYISAQSGSIRETTTSTNDFSTTNLEDNDKIKDKDQNIDMLPNLQLYGDK